MPYEKSVDIADNYAAWLLQHLSLNEFNITKIECVITIKVNGEEKQNISNTI